MNNYLKLLLHLKQFEGDGKMHPIEHLFPELTSSEQENVFKELVNENFIILTGREPRYDSFILEQNIITGETKVTQNPLNKLNREIEPDEFKAKITFKGSKYLKEEIEMQESGKYNINVSGSGTNNTFVIESTNIKVENKPNFVNKLDTIIETLESDQTLSDSIKNEVIINFEKAKQEIDQTGKLPERMIKGILQYGSQISSIGNLVLRLFL